MANLARITIRGLAPASDVLTDDDIVEIDGDAPPASSVRPAGVSVPPPSGKRYVPTSRYSVVVPRVRRTLRLVGDDE